MRRFLQQVNTPFSGEQFKALVNMAGEKSLSRFIRDTLIEKCGLPGDPESGRDRTVRLLREGRVRHEAEREAEAAKDKQVYEEFAEEQAAKMASADRQVGEVFGQGASPGGAVG